jgi:hypothetical protein
MWEIRFLVFCRLASAVLNAGLQVEEEVCHRYWPSDVNQENFWGTNLDVAHKRLELKRIDSVPYSSEDENSALKFLYTKGILENEVDVIRKLRFQFLINPKLTLPNEVAYSSYVRCKERLMRLVSAPGDSSSRCRNF